MNGLVQRRSEMATRVREFSRTHPSTDPRYSIVLNRLEETLTRAEGIAARQHTGLTGARGVRAQREYQQPGLPRLRQGASGRSGEPARAAGEGGMSPTLVSEFEAASEAARSTRRDHVGARADLVPFKPKAIVVVPPGEGGVASPREGRGRGERTKAPVLIPDYLALIGDAQDGYLGIAGIGAVTAARLLDRRGPTAACGGWTEPIGDPRLPDRSGRRLP